MDNKLCFVQFLHPGVEHKPDKDNHWNTGKHKRKFLKRNGEYLNDNKKVCGEIVFWGEWEAQSKVDKIENSIPYGPNYIYKPYYEIDEIYKKLQNNKSNRSCSQSNQLQNTDPFVFGEHFFYRNCLQVRKGKRNQLSYLEKGSVILFGSCLNKNFVIDTVFVVGDYIDYNPKGYNLLKDKLKLPEEYIDVTLEPLSRQFKYDIELRLYISATYEKPFEDTGMFSYFPCQPYRENTQGFSRPNVKLKDIISQELNQNIKLSGCNNIDEVKSRYLVVTKQITNQGLNLGIKAEIPAPDILRFCPLLNLEKR